MTSYDPDFQTRKNSINRLNSLQKNINHRLDKLDKLRNFTHPNSNRFGNFEIDNSCIYCENCYSQTEKLYPSYNYLAARNSLDRSESEISLQTEHFDNNYRPTTDSISRRGSMAISIQPSINELTEYRSQTSFQPEFVNSLPSFQENSQTTQPIQISQNNFQIPIYQNRRMSSVSQVSVISNVSNYSTVSTYEQARQLCRKCLLSGSINIDSQWPYDSQLKEFLNSRPDRLQNPLVSTFFNLLGKYRNERSHNHNYNRQTIDDVKRSRVHLSDSCSTTYETTTTSEIDEFSPILDTFTLEQMSNLNFNDQIMEEEDKEENLIDIFLNNENPYQSQLILFLNKIERCYQNVSYHDKFHAVDVMIGAEVLMNQIEDEAKLIVFTPLERFTLLLAAACHDVGHPSVNSNYVYEDFSESVSLKPKISRNRAASIKRTRLKTEESVLTSCPEGTAVTEPEIKANNTEGSSCGLLEQIHSEIAINYLKKLEINILTENEDFMELFRQVILDTDMNQHGKKVKSLTNLVKAVTDFRSQNYDSLITSNDSQYEKQSAQIKIKENPFSSATNNETKNNRKQLLSIILHLADLSNPAKNFEDSTIWAKKVCTEFFQQGDMENFKFGNISNKLLNREITSIEDSQIGFIDFVVLPFVELWCELVDPEYQGQAGRMRSNLLRNKQMYQNKKEERKNNLI